MSNFSSKEVDLLASIFNIPLQDGKGGLSDESTQLKTLEYLKAQIEKQRLVLQNLYIHPLIPDTPLQEEIRSAIKEKLIPISMYADDVKKKLESSTKERCTTHLTAISLEKEEIARTIETLREKLDIKKTSHAAKRKHTDRLQNLRNTLNITISAQYEASRELEAVITGIQHPPEVRQEEFDALCAQQNTIDAQIKTLKARTLAGGVSFSTLRYLLPEQLMTKTESELQQMQQALNELITDIQNTTKETTLAAQSWNKRSQELFPSYYLVSTEFEALFKKCASFRETLFSTRVLTEEELNNFVQSYDAHSINLLLDTKNKSDSTFRNQTVDFVQKKLEEHKKTWSTLHSAKEQARVEALQALEQAQAVFQQYVPAMLHAQRITEFDAQLTDISTHIADAQYQAAKESAQQFITALPTQECTVGTEVISFEEMRSIHEKFRLEHSIDSIQQLGEKAQELMSTARLLHIALPHSYALIDMYLQRVIAFYTDNSAVYNIEVYQEYLATAQGFVEENEHAVFTYTQQGTFIEELESQQKDLLQQEEELISTKKNCTEKERVVQESEKKGNKLRAQAKQIEEALEQAQQDLGAKDLSEKAVSRAKKLVKVLKKAQTENIHELEQHAKSHDFDVSKLETIREEYLQSEALHNQKKAEFEQTRKEVSAQIQENVHPNIKAIVDQWEEGVATFRSYTEESIAYLNEHYLAHLKDSIISEHVQALEKCTKYWGTIEQSPNNESLLTSYCTLLGEYLGYFQDDMNQLRASGETFAIKKQYCARMKEQLFTECTALVRSFPNEITIPLQELPFTGNNAAQQIHEQIMLLSLETPEQEPQQFARIKTCRQELDSLRTYITELDLLIEERKKEDFQKLIFFRDRLLLEAKTRSEIAESSWPGWGEQLSYVRLAYTQITDQLSSITDNYLLSMAQTDLFTKQYERFQKTEQQLHHIDNYDPKSLINEFIKLETDIQACASNLRKASKIQLVYPKIYEELKKKINDLGTAWKTLPLEDSKQKIAQWKILYGEYQIQAELTQGDIQALLENAQQLRVRLEEHKDMFASFPKIDQKFQDTLSQIIPKMVQTVDHFDIVHPQYLQMQDLFEKIIAAPREIQHQESILHAQEDFAHRQKEDWKAFIEMFRSGILPEIKEVLQMQQQNPNIHTKEKSRILAYEQESKKAFEAAKNAGNSGQYEEGRIHLQKIKGILTRLKRFPNGVHAQKLKSLKNIADTWNTAQAKMEHQLNILKKTITTAILEEGVEVSQEKTIHPLFETLHKQLNKTNFDLSIMKLEAGEEQKKWKEHGLSIVRDFMAIADSPIAQQFENNPFAPVDWSAYKKSLLSIEKSFLLYRGA